MLSTVEDDIEWPTRYGDGYILEIIEVSTVLPNVKNDIGLTLGTG